MSSDKNTENKTLTRKYTYSYRNGGMVLSEIKKLLCGKYILRGDTMDTPNEYNVTHETFLRSDLHLNHESFRTIITKLFSKTGVYIQPDSFEKMRDVKDLYIAAIHATNARMKK